jgi:hypothetical protein
MTAFFDRGRCLGRFTRWLLFSAATSVTAGCGHGSPSGLLVATTSPAAQRVQLEAAYQRWATERIDPGSASSRIDWLVLAPGDDLGKLVARRNPPHVLLGVGVSAVDRLARDGRLSPVQGASEARWCVSRSSAARSPSESSVPHPEHEEALFADPRTDSSSLAWANSQLEDGQWPEGYARLVELAGHVPRIRQNGLTVDRSGPQEASTELLTAAIPTSAQNQSRAKEFIRFLIESQGFEPEPRAAVDDQPDTDTASLTAELLGATLVDAQDELWAAWSAVERAGRAERAREWLTEPPYWPPASIEKYLEGDGENGMALVETLAGELAPQPAARSALLRSWLAPRRFVDAKMLAELARADEGRLARDSRFRAWLRAEWTASARQRYRRVARLSALPPSSASTN